MTTVQRSAIVPHPAAGMFDLVNDVSAYPDRFDWCEYADVLEHEGEVMVARLGLRLGAMRMEFTTRNQLRRPEAIDLSLVEGPFRDFGGGWRFLALGDEACKVELSLHFETAGKLVGSALAIGFKGLADHLVDDFCRVARNRHA